jgi:hypothetical protein
MAIKKDKKVAVEGEERVGEEPQPSPAKIEGEFVGKYTTPTGLSVSTL